MWVAGTPPKLVKQMDPKNQPTGAGTPVPGEKTQAQIDLEAKLAAKEQELTQAQHTIINLKKEKKETPTTSTVDIDEIRAEAAKAASVEIEKIKTDLVGDVLEEELSKVAKTPEEKAAILKEYNEGIVKSGASRAKIAGDLAKAATFVNASKNSAQLEEAKRAAAAAEAAKSGAASGAGGSPAVEVKLSPAEEKWVNDTARMTNKTPAEVKAALLKNRK